MAHGADVPRSAYTQVLKTSGENAAFGAGSFTAENEGRALAFWPPKDCAAAPHLCTLWEWPRLVSVTRLNQTFSQFLLAKLLFCDGPNIL